MDVRYPNRQALIFDIKEFAINDGPGVRVTVLFKGCPLRCCWCHNPEGLDFNNEINRATGQLVGKTWDTVSLFEYLVKFKDIFQLSGGGVTFSGGEPLYKIAFLSEVIKLLTASGIHIAVETSGYVDKINFVRLSTQVDLFLYDLKIVDDKLHQMYTGLSNQKILENCRYLSQLGRKYWIRVPLVPGVTDTKKNLLSICDFVSKELINKPERIELLNYNTLAGAKYPNFNRKFKFQSKRSVDESLVNLALSYAQDKGLNIFFVK